MRLVLRTKIHAGWVVEGNLEALTRSQRQGLRDVSLSFLIRLASRLNGYRSNVIENRV